MKRRIRHAIALAVCLLQAAAPFVAYATARPGTGLGDLCSAYGNAQSVKATPASLPFTPTDHHPASHCAYCPGGSAAAAVLPPTITPVFATSVGAVLAPSPMRSAAAAAPVLLPPSRGPPASSIPA